MAKSRFGSSEEYISSLIFLILNFSILIMYIDDFVTQYSRTISPKGRFDYYTFILISSAHYTKHLHVRLLPEIYSNLLLHQYIIECRANNPL